MKIATKLLIATLATTALLGGTVAVPAQAMTASAVQAHTPNAETTQAVPQPNRRASQFGVHNGSSRLIWVWLSEGHWVDGTPSGGWRPMQPGTTAFIVGDEGGFSHNDVVALITPGGGDGKTYKIDADNNALTTAGSTSFDGGHKHSVAGRAGSFYTQVGTIDKATMAYANKGGDTEFWDVTVANK